MLNLPTTLWSTVSVIPYLCDLGGIEGNRIMAFTVYFVFQMRNWDSSFLFTHSCFSPTQFLVKQRLKAY